MLAFQVPLKPSLKQTCICSGIWTEANDSLLWQWLKSEAPRLSGQLHWRQWQHVAVSVAMAGTAMPGAAVVLWIVIQSIWAWFSIPPSDPMSCSKPFNTFLLQSSSWWLATQNTVDQHCVIFAHATCFSLSFLWEYYVRKHDGKCRIARCSKTWGSCQTMKMTMLRKSLCVTAADLVCRKLYNYGLSSCRE